MNPEDRLRALNDSDRWTVNAIQPRENPFGSTAPVRRGQSWRMIFAEIGVVVAVGAIIFGAIVLQSGSEDNLSNPVPLPDVTSSTPAPAPSPTVTPPVVTPTPPPVPPAAPVAEKVVVTTRALELQTNSGEVVESFLYNDDDWQAESQAMSAALSELFGEEPTVTEMYSQVYWGKYFEYQWGDGFLAYVRGDKVIGGDRVFELFITGSEVRGIPVETKDGFSIGTPIDDVTEFVEEEYGQTRITSPGEEGGFLTDRIYLTGERAKEEDKTLPEGIRSTDGVSVSWAKGDATITEIRAPGRNYGN